jgi:2-keto-4-pentenoate hydratase/2-oxohepta-3-ene-1,7-dioic acid hydratase in catechol pathway
MIVSFIHQGRAMWGRQVPGGVLALSDAHPGWHTLRHVIAAGALLRMATEDGPFLPDHDITLTIPIPDPEKILCVGVNYPDRNAEYRDGQDAPQHPSLFVRFPRSFTGHGSPLIRPPESAQLDYEGEVALVIGRGGRRIAAGDALDHIAALTLANEGTIRDWVRHGKFNVTQGKNWDQSGSIGPGLVPFTDPSQLADIRLTTTVNGVVRQDDRTSRMIFSPATIIAYVSTFATLIPGDIILTGTPTGAGARLDPPVWLVPGDVVTVAADGLGTLTNTVTG